ncbi:xanthine dehydrogenase accessory protein XdhC [Epibacterium sp. SM1979]|uniref:Xanthine dehydrogenase accessory protein XdhC n=1 Tax=Tritonibacter litoralis TaxID=2662264 RepID=A0A843YGT0_9RHOB|nr:xanthine dehydrogenase accessory protein XdhC [Tritonibacter litoralis]MQQ09028.1 xanthine dehydrogenase accessory protein XdhC [Tritonibacter litoralis]
MSFDLDALRRAVADHGRVTRVVIAAIRGSSPREVGAAMLVWETGQSGTIGGGALEYELAASARKQRAPTAVIRRALGPDLGQCCGGALTLVSEVYDAARLAALDTEVIARPVEAPGDMPLRVSRLLADARGQGERPAAQLVDGWLVEPVLRPETPVWIWGAGHVGRAMVDVMQPLPDLDITWVDTAANRFPAKIPERVTAVPTADPLVLVPHAPQNAQHLVLTYSHALDLALCNALLAHGFAFAGVIGSATKWARFRRRLAEMGHSAARIDRLTCPIGDPGLGKHPQMIAIGVTADMLRRAAQDQQRPDHIRQGNREDRRA